MSALTGMFKTAATFGGSALQGPNRDADQAAFNKALGIGNPNTAPQTTILASIAPETNFRSVALSSSTKTSIDPTATTSCNKATIQNAQKDASADIENVTMAKAAITATIEAAQNEVRSVLAALKENDPSIRNPFASKSSGTTGAQVVSDATQGASTTIVQALYDEITSGPKARDPAEVIAMVEAELSHRQTAPNQNGVWDASMPSAPTASAQPAPAFDWKEFQKQGHDLEAFMAIDPENPPESLVPEWEELNEHGNRAEELLAYYAGLLEELGLDKDEFTAALEECSPLPAITMVALDPSKLLPPYTDPEKRAPNLPPSAEANIKPPVAGIGPANMGGIMT